VCVCACVRHCVCHTVNVLIFIHNVYFTGTGTCSYEIVIFVLQRTGTADAVTAPRTASDATSPTFCSREVLELD